jgi:DNA 3'-phosphatase
MVLFVVRIARVALARLDQATEVHHVLVNAHRPLLHRVGGHDAGRELDEAGQVHHDGRRSVAVAGEREGQATVLAVVVDVACLRSILRESKIDIFVIHNQMTWQQEGSCGYKVGTTVISIQDSVYCYDYDETLAKRSTANLLPGVKDKILEHFSNGDIVAVFTNRKRQRPETVIKNLEAFEREINLPGYIWYFFSLEDDNYRKPNTGMYDLFTRISGVTCKPVYFCGDAAGRPGDFSDSDREFAMNIGTWFKTPEEVGFNHQ